ncbi:MAG: PAS domain-containing protein, partial [Cyclobacteriaceae bacterium]|nr:PAS domain-containing protein [Cyclobacteriaceae bacterium]
MKQNPLKNILYGLSFRIWFPFALSITILLASLLVLYPSRQSTLFKQNFETEFNQLARTTALGVNLALRNNDFEGLADIIDLANVKSELEYIALVEEDSLGNLTVFASNPEGVNPELILNADSINYLLVKNPIISDDLNGFVALAISNKVIEEAIFRINYPIYVFLGIILVMSLGLFYGIAERIATPITYLTNISNRLQTGEYDIEIETISNVDEISSLNTSLIELKEHLLQAKIQNEEFNFKLEEQIQARTKALEETKNRLIEAQRIAKLGNYEVNLITGEWQNSEMIDDIFRIPDDFERNNNSWRTFLNEKNSEKLIDAFYRCRVFKESFKMDLQIVDPLTQESKWISITGSPVVLSNQDIRTVTGTIQDITDRKVIEREVEKLSLVAKRTSNGVIITDTDLKITWANEAFLNLSEYSLEEIIGQTPRMFQFEKTDHTIAKQIKNDVLKGKNVTAEILNRG